MLLRCGAEFARRMKAMAPAAQGRNSPQATITAQRPVASGTARA
jgi:hypothetical protein